MDASDFLTHFLDLALPELSKPASTLSLTKVQSLLDLVLRNPSSVSFSDPFKDDLKCELGSMTLVHQLLRISSVSGVDSSDHTYGSNSSSSKKDIDDVVKESSNQVSRPKMRLAESNSHDIGKNRGLYRNESTPITGIDAFVLNLSVQFPVSLILNKKSMTKYQLLFRHLFYCKHVERLLCSSWLDQKYSCPSTRTTHSSPSKLSNQENTPFHKESNGKSDSKVRIGEKEKSLVEIRKDSRILSPQLRSIQSQINALRMRMLTFVQQLLYYACFEVLEPNWRALEVSLQKVDTVDEVLSYHEDFLDTCLKECLLTNPKLLKVRLFIWRPFFKFSE